MKLFDFAGWQFFGNCGSLMRGQACSLLTNIYFGPKVNAAYGISNQVLSQTGTLAQALITAFTPAITTAEGAGDRKGMVDFSWKTSRFGTFLVLLFLLPVILEIREILVLWLKDPPQWSAELCTVACFDVIFGKITVGQQLAIAAQGKIKRYQITLGILLILAFPIGWGLILLGLGPMSVVFALLITTILCSLGRVYFGWKQLNMSPRYWLNRVVLPLLFFSCCVALIGSFPKLIMEPSFWRVLCSAALSVSASVILGWFIILEKEEKYFLINKIRMIYCKLTSSP